jgi:hypothetical protein
LLSGDDGYPALGEAFAEIIKEFIDLVRERVRGVDPDKQLVARVDDERLRNLRWIGLDDSVPKERGSIGRGLMDEGMRPVGIRNPPATTLTGKRGGHGVAFGV